MKIRITVNVDKDYFIKALAYWLFHGNRNIDEVTKKIAKEILRNSVYWQGKSGWTGISNQVTDIIGEFEAFDDYEKC